SSGRPIPSEKMVKLIEISLAKVILGLSRMSYQLHGSRAVIFSFEVVPVGLHVSSHKMVGVFQLLVP
ncbi:MAG: hypothetical protein PHO09_13805, partial [Sphaerochaeta sp.]|nr:hypothetical protein [Sphaerochaeta sp.]